MGRIIPYIVENKKCLKPPPSHQTINVWNPQPAWLYPSFPRGCDTLRYTHRQARQAAFDQLPATIQQAVEEFVVLGRWHRPGIGFIYIYALFDILCLSWENSLIMFDIIRVHDILHSCIYVMPIRVGSKQNLTRIRCVLHRVSFWETSSSYDVFLRETGVS